MNNYYSGQKYANIIKKCPAVNGYLYNYIYSNNL